MPNQYAAEDDDSEYSEQDASVMDLSVDTTAEDDDEDDHGVDEGSVAEYDEDLSEYSEEEDDPRAHRRGGGGGGHHSAIRSTGEPPRRAKSFDGDARHHASSSRGGGGGGSGQLDRGGAVERKANSHHERGGSRRTPARGKSFDSGRRQPSMRSLGGPKMRRDTSTKMDKEAIASNRARRLRAMGGGDTGRYVRRCRPICSSIGKLCVFS